MNPAYPDNLRTVEFIRLRFHLEFQEPFRLTTEAALRLRRDLRQAGRTVLSGGAPFGELFDPPLSPDPAALRRFQRPGPPFVILPPVPLPRDLEEGDGLELEILFWGRGIHRVADFARVLQALGKIGWHRGEGCFEMAALEAVDASGTVRRLWRPPRDFASLAPPVLEAQWWLETAAARHWPLEFTFVTPARLIQGGRPLFRPTFARLFPFLLRRVTSLVHACCGLELLDDPAPLLAAARRVQECRSTLAWSDWRTLEGGECPRDLGGITGSVRLEGEGLEEILWILNLVSLMNVGKGASFGSGHLILREC